MEADFMRLAIVASERAVAGGNMPFGATLVQDDRVLHVSGEHGGALHA